MKVIELRNISKVYDSSKAVTALKNINFELNQGERVAIMGPSGSGKSTLLNIIAGLDEPSAGQIVFEGRDISELNDDQRTRLRRERIGIIFQTFNLLSTLTAQENVALPLRLKGIGRREAMDRAAKMLDRVRLTERQTHRPDELSGGERQRVAIARALIFQPPLLLGDEPTGNLDSKTGNEILALLDELHREFNTTILLVTHNAQAAEHCDQVLTMKDGELVSTGVAVVC
ncbi:MAG TPA: ABC transporter ATP-binding protein [Acidobacteriota bacterium]|nr:ABC transporter ATP-binding protein [Acidobacteriota bacterium]HNJ40026.1 ABC transporter ATP-binding protein [Acidobacteriota bacterium]